MGSRVGLIDVDAESRGKVTFPNLALMKISAWHKAKGDTVEWYQPLISGHMDLVYMSRVFGDEYTKDYPWPVDADQVIRGGSGYAISVVDGEEVHNKAADPPLPDEIERMCTDYSIYDFPSTAYGFLTKGCPRGCPFCLVESMQGRRVVTVSHLSDWWHGEKHIVLLDPNITASRDWSEHMYALAMSEAKVDFSQGLDIRLMTPTKYAEINTVKWERIHFAWDNPADDLERDFAQAMRLLRGARKETVSAYAPFDISHKCCDVMKKNPVKKYEKETNRKPMIATMASESALRASKWMKFGCNAYEQKRATSQPMSFWTEQDVLHYIKQYNVPYCTVYGDIRVKRSSGELQDQMNLIDYLGCYEPEDKLETTGCSRTGCMFCMFGCHLEKQPNRFQRMKTTHSKQYEYCMDKLGLKEVLGYIGVPYE